MAPEARRMSNSGLSDGSGLRDPPDPRCDEGLANAKNLRGSFYDRWTPTPPSNKEASYCVVEIVDVDENPSLLAKIKPIADAADGHTA